MWYQEVAAQAVPTKRLGLVSPLDLIDTSLYEFYRIAPPNVIVSTTSIGLSGFSSEAARAAIDQNRDRCVAQLAKRNVEYISLSGIPLLLHLGADYSKRFADWCESVHGIPAGTSVDAAASAFHALGAQQVVALNKWDQAQNQILTELFSTYDVNIVANVSEEHTADQVKSSYEQGIDVALRLVERAVSEYPKADCLYLAGGAWLVLGLIAPIEERFGIPVVAGQQSKIWYTLNRIGAFEPRDGWGQLLSIAGLP